MRTGSATKKTMKKVFLGLVVLLLSATSVWAEVEAPTMPVSVAPESGGTYYLYNVESNLFLTNVESSTSYVGVGMKGRPILVTKEANGAYTLKFADNNYSIYNTSDSYVSIRSSSYHNYDYWTISESDNAYLIQRAPQNTSYYKADQYVGRAGETSDYVYANRTATDAIHWLFFAANDAAEHYAAERALYESMTKVEGLFDKGWGRNNYTKYADLYDDRENANDVDLYSAAEELTHAVGMSSGYEAPEWNEYPILFATPDGKYGDDESSTWALPNNNYSTGNYFHRRLYSSDSDISSISATISVNGTSAFVYELHTRYSSAPFIKVYVDGVLTRELDNLNSGFGQAGDYDRFFETIDAGIHTITWVVEKADEYSVLNVGCISVDKQITADLLEPGSLGTEVLNQTDHIKNVRRLKVRGKMNDDDWQKIQMMSYLYELDLSEAEADYVPESQFDGSSADHAARFLRTVYLPNKLLKIGKHAFHYTYVETVKFPQSCPKIEGEAFYVSHIKEAILPNDLEELGNNSKHNSNHTNAGNYNSVFMNCKQLREASLGYKITIINCETFEGCSNLIKVDMPDVITSIYSSAFNNCEKLQLTALPKELKTIGSNAFSNCKSITSIVIPSSVTNIGSSAFDGCSGLQYAEIGVNMNSLPERVFSGCSSLTTLRLNSSTVVKITDNSRPTNDEYRSNITLQVPSFAVNNYKLDQYWYNFKVVEGFETDEVPYWAIRDNLVLNRERFGGCPNIKIYAGNSLKINGDTQQQFDNVEVDYNSCLLSNCNNLTINGDLTLWYQMGTANKNKNSWHFTSLPFDMKVGDIDTNGAQLAIRAYDGANRATNGTTGSWKKLTADDIVPAGMGFIFQADQDVWIGFKAMNNDTKQYIVSPDEFVKTLAANESATASNAGWNLVGNPYQCYYNDHMLSFTGPITVWNGTSYTAYSITDDDYAIRPNEAFFVQCPENVSSISFPTQGRQLTSVIESQNAVPGLRTEAAGTSRCLIDLTVSRDSLTDRTRVVLNEQATLGYELTRDASKFMSMDTRVPQLYTVDADGTQYAINERPVADGTALVGFYAPTKGTYTFSLSRCDADHVWLTDRETGLTVNLAEGDYVFSAEAGTTAQRFMLGLEGATKIEHAVSDEEEAVIYDLSGRIVKQPVEGIYLQNGQKVIIR